LDIYDLIKKSNAILESNPHYLNPILPASTKEALQSNNPESLSDLKKWLLIQSASNLKAYQEILEVKPESGNIPIEGKPWKRSPSSNYYKDAVFSAVVPAKYSAFHL
jgi:hypothetical protein